MSLPHFSGVHLAHMENSIFLHFSAAVILAQVRGKNSSSTFVYHSVVAISLMMLSKINSDVYPNKASA